MFAIPQSLVLGGLQGVERVTVWGTRAGDALSATVAHLTLVSAPQ